MIALDIAAFRAAFPAFSDETDYPDALLNTQWAFAQCYFTDNSCDCDEYKLWLMLAHLLFINDQITAGNSGQVVASATEGPVNVSFAQPPNTSNFTYWLQTSPYGIQLSALLNVNQLPEYYGGSSSLGAFYQW